MVVGLFCGVLWVCFMVAVGLLVVAMLCWWCCVGVGLCFFFFGSATGVCGCGWWGDGGVRVCGSVGVGFGSVGGGVSLLPGFFFFFFFLCVDGRLWVTGGGCGGGGDCGVRCV